MIKDHLNGNEYRKCRYNTQNGHDHDHKYGSGGAAGSRLDGGMAT